MSIVQKDDTRRGIVADKSISLDKSKHKKFKCKSIIAGLAAFALLSGETAIFSNFEVQAMDFIAGENRQEFVRNQKTDITSADIVKSLIEIENTTVETVRQAIAINNNLIAQKTQEQSGLLEASKSIMGSKSDEVTLGAVEPVVIDKSLLSMGSSEDTSNIVDGESIRINPTANDTDATPSVKDPEVITPKQPHINVAAGSVSAEIVSHEIAGSDLADLQGTDYVRLVIAVVDKRSTSSRDIVYVDVLDKKGTVVSSTSGKCPSDSTDGIYWVYATISTGLLPSTNNFTLQLRSSSGTITQNTDPYKIDAREYSNFKVLDNTTIRFISAEEAAASGSSESNLIVFDLHYAVSNTSSTPYKLEAYCDDTLLASTGLIVGVPGEYSHTIKYFRDEKTPAGEHTYKLMVNSDKAVFETNYLDNSYETNLVLQSSRIPDVKVAVAGNVSQGATAADLEVPVTISNRGSDILNAPLVISMKNRNGDMVEVYNHEISVAGGDSYDETIKIPVASLISLLTQYKKGDMISETGETLGVKCAGTYVSVQLGSNTFDYCDVEGALSPDDAVAGFFAYWDIISDVSITMTPVGTVVGDSVNIFDVVVKNESKVVPYTTGFEIVTSGYSDVVAYRSEDFEIPAGQSQSFKVQIYCQNAVGTNYVTAQLTCDDDIQSNNKRVVSYLCEGNADLVNATVTDTLKDRIVIAGQELNYESALTFRINQAEQLPDSVDMHIVWYLNGSPVDEEVITYNPNGSRKFYHNYGTSTGHAHAYLWFDNEITGKRWERTTGGCDLGASGVSYISTTDDSEILSLGDASKLVRGVVGGYNDSAVGTITYYYNDKVIKQEDTVVKLGSNSWSFKYDLSPSEKPASGSCEFYAILSYINPGTGESENKTLSSFSYPWNDTPGFWVANTWTLNIPSWGSPVDDTVGGVGGDEDNEGGISAPSTHGYSVTITFKNPKPLPTHYNAILTYFLDSTPVATANVEVTAGLNSAVITRHTKLLDTAKWSAGNHELYTVWDLQHTNSSGQPMRYVTGKQKITVVAGNDVFVSNLKLDGNKTSYRTGERIKGSVVITNKFSNEIKDMRVIIKVPGTEFQDVQFIDVPGMSDTRFSFQIPTTGIFKGKLLDMIGNRSVDITVNVDEDGHVANGDSTIENNKISTAFEVADSQPLDVYFESAELLNPQAVYTQGEVPQFRLLIGNDYSEDLTLRVYAARIDNLEHLFDTTFNISAARLTVDSYGNTVIAPAHYRLTVPVPLTESLTYEVQWFVEIVTAEHAGSETNTDNNKTEKFRLKSGIVNDLSVDSIYCKPSSATEPEQIDLYFTITNKGPNTCKDVNVTFMIGAETDSSNTSGFFQFKEDFPGYYSQEFKIVLQSKPDDEYPYGMSAFAELGSNLPVTLKLSGISASQNQNVHNDSATCYVTNMPQTDVYIDDLVTKCGKDAILYYPSGSTYPVMQRGMPVAYFDLSVLVHEPSNMLVFPNGKLRITFEGHPDFYSPICETAYVGEYGGWLNGVYENSYWNGVDGKFPVAYDGVEQDVTVVIEILPNDGHIYNNPNGRVFRDTNLTNNIKKFKVHFPECDIKLNRDFTVAFNKPQQSWSRGEDLNVHVRWHDIFSTKSTDPLDRQRTCKREIFVNDTLVWSSNDPFYISATATYTDYTFTTKDLDNAGVDMTGDEYVVKAVINGDRAVTESTKETQSNYGKEYDNNTAVHNGIIKSGTEPVVPENTVDFAVNKLTISPASIAKPGAILDAAIEFRNLSTVLLYDEDFGQTDPDNTSGGKSPLDVPFALKRNGVIITTGNLKDFGAKSLSSMTTKVQIPADASRQCIYEVVINPDKNYNEVSFSNNSKTAVVIVDADAPEIKPEVERIDMAAWFDPVAYVAQEGDSTKIIMAKAIMVHNTTKSITEFNTIANLYINDVLVDQADVIWEDDPDSGVKHGKANVSWVLSADRLTTAGIYTLKCVLNEDKNPEEVAYDNNSSTAQLQVKALDAPDDYAVRDLSYEYKGDSKGEVTVTYLNIAKADVEDIRVGLYFWDEDGAEWRYLCSDNIAIPSNHGVKYTYSFTEYSFEGLTTLKLKATINENNKYNEVDYTNNAVEAEYPYDGSIDISAEWIKSVTKADYERFINTDDTSEDFTEINTVMPGDPVYLIAKMKNNAAHLMSSKGLYTISCTSANGITANSDQKVKGDYREIPAGKSKWFGAVMSFEEDVVDITFSFTTYLDDNPDNNSATTQITVADIHEPNLTAKSITVENLTTGNIDLILPGDTIKVTAVYSSGADDISDHYWKILIRDDKGNKIKVYDLEDCVTSEGEAYRSIGRYVTRTLELEFPYEYYSLEGHLTFELIVDPEDKVAEIDETDNSATFEYLFYNIFDLAIAVDGFNPNDLVDDQYAIPVVWEHTGLYEDVPVDIVVYLDGNEFKRIQTTTMTEGAMTLYLPEAYSGSTIRIEINPAEGRVVSETTYTNNVASLDLALAGDPNISVPATGTVANVGADKLESAPFEIEDAIRINEFLVNYSHIKSANPLIIRTRLANKRFADMPDHYEVVGAESARFALSAFATTFQFNSNPMMYGDCEFEFEINPPVPSEMRADLEAEAATKSLVLNWLPDGRLCEESEYADNIFHVDFHVNEHPDYSVAGLSVAENGSTSEITSGDEFIQGKFNGIHLTWDLSGVSLFEYYEEIPYVVYVTDPKGQTTTLDSGTFTKYFEVTKDGDSFVLNSPTHSITRKLPTDTLGVYTVIARINEGFVKPEEEAYRGNNVLTYKYRVKTDPNSVNFVTNSLTMTSSPYAGYEQVYTAKITQTGNKIYTGEVQWMLYRPDPEDPNRFIIYKTGYFGVTGKTCEITGITTDLYTEPGEEFTMNFWINPRVFGDFSDVGVELLQSKYITEVSTSDNTASCSETIRAEPVDLVANSITVVGDCVSGSPVTIKTSVTNSAKTVMVPELKYSILFNGRVVMTGMCNPMMPEETLTLTDGFVLPVYSGAGTFQIIFNSDRVLLESNYDNNTATANVTVKKPQLNLVAVSITPDPVIQKRNQLVKFKIEIKNSSDGIDLPHDVENVVYTVSLANGNSIYRGDIPKIKIDETYLGEFMAFVPVTAPYGPLDFILEVNPQKLQSANIKLESDYTDNTQTANVYVDPPHNLKITEGKIDPVTIPEGDSAHIIINIENEDPINLYSVPITVTIDSKKFKEEIINVPSGGSLRYICDVPDLSLGKHNVMVTVNGAKVQAEDIYTDNNWSGSVTVRQGKDYAASITVDSPIVSKGEDFQLYMKLSSDYKNPVTVPYYIKYRGKIVYNGSVSFNGKETKSITQSIAAGNVLGFADIEVGINTAKMANEEYNTNNNIAYLSVKVRDHNVDGTVDFIKLTVDTPVEITLRPGEQYIDSVFKADDPTSVITSIVLDDGTGVTPGINKYEFKWPIVSGTDIKATVTITTDDNYLSQSYVVIFHCPSDDVDANVYIDNSAGTVYQADREGDTFTVSLPADFVTGKIVIEAITDNSYISSVQETITRDRIVILTDLTELFSARKMVVRFSGKSGSGMKRRDFVLNIYLDNDPPTITITNADELDGAIYNKSYGKLLAGTAYAYGPGITHVAEAITAEKTHGVVVEVLANDPNPEQYLFSEVVFKGKKYPIYWNDYNGTRTEKAAGDLRGFAYISSNDLADNAKNVELKAYVYDTMNNVVGDYLSRGESNSVYISMDNLGPSGNVSMNTGTKTINVTNIKDDIAGQKEVSTRIKQTMYTKWSGAKTNNVVSISSTSFVYPEAANSLDIEVTLVDKLNNKTVVNQTVLLPSDGVLIDVDGAYAKNSRNSTSVFINVRYRGSEEVDLSGFTFLD